MFPAELALRADVRRRAKRKATSRRVGCKWVLYEEDRAARRGRSLIEERGSVAQKSFGRATWPGSRDLGIEGWT
jgi:hypothetical protein